MTGHRFLLACACPKQRRCCACNAVPSPCKMRDSSDDRSERLLNVQHENGLNRKAGRRNCRGVYGDSSHAVAIPEGGSVVECTRCEGLFACCPVAGWPLRRQDSINRKIYILMLVYSKRKRKWVSQGPAVFTCKESHRKSAELLDCSKEEMCSSAGRCYNATSNTRLTSET